MSDLLICWYVSPVLFTSCLTLTWAWGERLKCICWLGKVHPRTKGSIILTSVWCKPHERRKRSWQCQYIIINWLICINSQIFGWIGSKSFTACTSGRHGELYQTITNSRLVTFFTTRFRKFFRIFNIKIVIVIIYKNLQS